MSLADALHREKQAGTRKGPDCRLCVTLRSLKSEDLTALQKALDDEAMTGAAISRALKAEGHDVTAVVVLRHRKGDCRA